MKKIIAYNNDIFINHLMNEKIDLKLIKNTNQKIIDTINSHPSFSQEEKNNLINIYQLTFNNALIYLKLSSESNLMVHSPIVTLLMLKIATEEKLNYEEFKQAMLIAFLHQIGNADTKGKKYSRSMIREKINQKNIAQAIEYAKATVNFRFKHMQKSSDFINIILNPLLEDNKITAAEIDLITKVAKMHDYPSIALLLEQLKEMGIKLSYNPKDFLFDFKNDYLSKMISLIREADTLFILTWQGILTDLIRERKNFLPKEINTKLQYNINKFYQEYLLYKKYQKDDGEFINKTLFRTQTGYNLFLKMQNPVAIEEITKNIDSYNKVHIDSEKLNEVYENIKKSYCFNYDLIHNFVTAHIEEIEKGLKGESNCYLMLPSFVNPDISLINNKDEKILYGIDFGGFFFRVLKIKISPENPTPQIEFIKKINLDHKIKSINNANDLFNYFALKIKKTLEQTRDNNKPEIKMGFSLSYPFESYGLQNARLLLWVKDFSANDAIGKNPLELLEKALKNNQVNNVKITALANDTVASLINGIHQFKAEVAMVIGTSTNIAVSLPVSETKKPYGYYAFDKMIFNVQSASRISLPYENKIMTKYDRTIPTMINSDGTEAIGKLFSGNYFSQIVKILLLNSSIILNKQHPLHNANLSLPNLFTEICELPINQNLKEQLNKLFAKNQLAIEVSNLEDAKKFHEICHLILKKASLLASCYLIGTIKYLDPELKKNHTVVIDGSVYIKNKLFREQINKILADMQINNINIKAVNDGSGIGAAILSQC